MRAKYELSRIIIVIGFVICTIALAILFILSNRHDALTARVTADLVSEAELESAIADHEKWVAAGNCSPNRKTGVADVGRPDFIGDSVKTTHKQMSWFLRDLRGADLSNHNLRCANFIGTVLKDASFFGADLRGAIFTHADLSNVNLSESDLRGAIFHFANLSGAIFEPAYIPQNFKVALADNLSQLKYDESPRALYELKRSMKEAGYIQSEKQIIASLNKNQLPISSFSNDAANILKKVAFWVRYSLFGLTSDFGSNAILPLLWIYVIYIVFSVIYMFAIDEQGKTGLYYRFPRQVMKDGLSEWIETKIVRPSLYSRLEIAMAFSLRSALRLGFQAFDFGRWIRMLQHREYDIIGVGWPRTMSAVQSLLSIYLIALSILSGFGKPFDL